MSTRNTDSPSVRFFDLLARRGAREQQHQIGMLGARGPDLLAVDDVAALPSRTAVVRRLSVSVPEVGSVTPNACSRNSPLAMPGRYCSFCSALPCRSTRAHGVHLGVAGGAVAAGGVDFLQDRGRRRHRRARCRRIPPGSARRESRPWSAPRRTRSDRRARGRACASIRRESPRTARAPPRGSAQVDRSRPARSCPHLGAAVVHRHHIALEHQRAEAHHVAVAPDFGADGLAREHRRREPPGASRPARSGS